MERKLASIRKVSEINPIPGADSIEVLTIGGWKVVSQKGNFQPGDLCCYFEVDSFMPESDPRYTFLMKSGVREMDGVRGHKLRTVKLRGQISQGLALPLSEMHIPIQDVNEGDDLTAILGIKKYEGPAGILMSGQVKGGFPSFVRKTDQERCQNLVREIFEENKDSEYEVSIKLDGSSVTYYHYNGELGACSRNLEWKINEENKDNTMIKFFAESGLQEALKKINLNVAIQGEIMGPGVQGNRENFKTHKFFVFDMQDIDTGMYYTPVTRKIAMGLLRENGVIIDHVPLITRPVDLDGILIDYEHHALKDLKITNIEELLTFAEGPSVVHPIREGVVFKRMDGKFSFKAISNAFLLKEKN